MMMACRISRHLCLQKENDVRIKIYVGIVLCHFYHNFLMLHIEF